MLPGCKPRSFWLDNNGDGGVTFLLEGFVGEVRLVASIIARKMEGESAGFIPGQVIQHLAYWTQRRSICKIPGLIFFHL
jgi:hypothetical protein